MNEPPVQSSTYQWRARLKEGLKSSSPQTVLKTAGLPFAGSIIVRPSFVIGGRYSRSSGSVRSRPPTCDFCSTSRWPRRGMRQKVPTPLLIVYLHAADAAIPGVPELLTGTRLSRQISEEAGHGGGSRLVHLGMH